MPVPCQNCQNSPCTKVCPVGATYYSEDNIVLIDQNRCIGCRICLASCPYERRFFNWYDPPVTEEEKKIAYSPDYNIPHRRGVAEKCVWCRHRTKMGMVPACVEACTRAGMKALWFGDAAQDVVSNGVDTARLSTMIQGRGAYRFKDELGTSPSVLYLPPRGGTTT
jgi:molybdopterin-containing oxidoreductase family iron-sulfur binding subunit